ncbi:site-specific integrase [Paraburkholderia mimosarum]|uniref:hypothetical protein n=1 Tax=Paraburkholderia mimosarum TaxID=312026 RepID=UPI0006845814|nr:hypothetical protein [Paraburkholderia mimosarum]
MSRRTKSLSAAEQARRLVSQVLILGHKKSDLGAHTRDLITSLGTARNYQQCVKDFLEWRLAAGVGVDAVACRLEIENYLLVEGKRWRQKTLDQHRQALALVFCITLPVFDADIETFVDGRAYTHAEVCAIAKRQCSRHSLSTHTIFYSGMRAVEMYELREVDELERTADRPWRNDLFTGFPDGALFSTTGKGGLIRLVWLPSDLAEAIRKVRLGEPLEVIDRGINRTSMFDVGGGQNLSQSFTDASKRALGYSLGIHGLRHAYVQRHLETLLRLKFAVIDALEIVSQYVGHLRPEISLAYTPRRNGHDA